MLRESLILTKPNPPLPVAIQPFVSGTTLGLGGWALKRLDAAAVQRRVSPAATR